MAKRQFYMRHKPGEPLTSREEMVGEMLKRGMTDQQIGHELGVGDAAVRYNILAMQYKLGVFSRLKIAIVLIERELGTPGRWTDRK